MKIRKIFSFVCVFSLMAALLAGCSKQQSGALDGKWAYNHEPERTAFKVDGGTAVLDGVRYTCSYDDSVIVLTDKNGNTQNHRYVVDGEDILLYKTATYTYAGGSVPDGFYGFWKNEDNWSWEFAKNGEFCEDGYFPGHFAADEENHEITLMYNDHYYDTHIYYNVDGNILTIEYPWRMVRQ